MKQRNKTVSRGVLAVVNNEQASIQAGKSKTYMSTVNRERPDIKVKIEEIELHAECIVEIVASM